MEREREREREREILLAFHHPKHTHTHTHTHTRTLIHDIFDIQEKFKTGLLHSAEEFKKTVANIADDFESKGPFTAAVPIAEAMEFITNMRSQLAQLKLQESNIRKGLNIFKIDQPPSHIIVGLDKVCIIRSTFNYSLYMYQHQVF